MADIRLSKLSKQFGIGLGTLVEFIQSKGIEVENNPNAKVSDEIIPDLEAKFGADLKAKQEADKVTTKLKEMIEGSTTKKKEEEEDFVKPDIIIKSNLTSVAKPLEKKEESKPVIAPLKETEIHAEKLAGPKVVDKIDLNAIGKKKAEEKAAKPDHTLRNFHRRHTSLPSPKKVRDGVDAYVRTTRPSTGVLYANGQRNPRSRSSGS